MSFLNPLWSALRTAPAGLLAFASGALAEAPSPPSVQVWVDPGLYSYHLEARNLREDNYGFGVGVYLTPEHGFVAGSLINSNRRRSRYAAYHWRPWHWTPGPVRVSAGFIAGLIDGYPSTNDGNPFPIVLPVLSAEYGPVGANLSFIPYPRTRAAIALQLRLRVW